MNIQKQKKPAFIVAGIDREFTDSSQMSNLWDELFTKYTIEELSELGTGQSIGVCHSFNHPHSMHYMAGYIITDIEKAKELGLKILEIPETQYAILSIIGPVPECIHNGWKYMEQVYFPENKLKHSGQPDFEVYNHGDMSSPDYTMELWVPIIEND